MRVRACSGVFLLVGVVAASVACSATPATGGATDAGQDAGGRLCPARPDLVAAAPTCTNLGNSAIAIPFTASAGTPPTPTGGAILDGLYESTRTEGFGTTAGNGRRITFAILDGATRMLWDGEVLNATGTAPVQPAFRADTGIAVAGTRIDFTINCVSSAPSPIPASLDFSVSGMDLVLSLGSAATTYTRRGCAPP